MLKEFAEDSDLSNNQAALFIRDLESEHLICGGKDMLSWSDLVSRAKSYR